MPIPSSSPKANTIQSSRPETSQAARELADQGKLLSQQVISEIARVVVGMEDVTQQLLIALIANGHVLLEGVPGVAKTTLSKAFAGLLGCQYQRVQFTPDLLPSDVTGTSIFDQKTNDFVLRKGPIFCQILLADEINRAPAKTQSALLEAMQEQQVTIDGTTLPLPRPFLVLATQNPVEQEGVYRLPEAQLDRFLIRVQMTYPGHDAEVKLLKLHSRPAVEITPLFSSEVILNLQSKLPEIYAKEELLHYIVSLVEASREHPDILLGGSPRAGLNLLRCARARAALLGRHYITHQDIQEIALSVLGHRIIVRPEAEVDGRQSADIVGELLETLPILGD